jgi:TrkA domain protein
MPEVRETRLPGVGVRHEFVTGAGDQVAVLAHRSGRREIAIYSKEDPDASAAVLHLTADDTRTLSDLLGGSQIAEVVSEVARVEGVALDWLEVGDDSPFVGTTIGEGQFRTRTGVSIVAVVRDGDTIPAPGPEHRFEAGDVAVAVGTPEGLGQLRDLLKR